MSTSFPVDAESHFEFRVHDGDSYTDIAIFEVEAKQLVLSLEKLRPLEAYPGILQPITAANLLTVTNDLEHERHINYHLQSKPENGLLVMVMNNGTTTEIATFSQDDINNKRVFYQHTSACMPLVYLTKSLTLRHQ